MIDITKALKEIVDTLLAAAERIEAAANVIKVAKVDKAGEHPLWGSAGRARAAATMRRKVIARVLPKLRALPPNKKMLMIDLARCMGEPKSTLSKLLSELQVSHGIWRGRKQYTPAVCIATLEAQLNKISTKGGANE